MHPAAELVEHYKALKQAGRAGEARTLLETAFSMALMEQAGRPVAVKIRPGGELPRPLASPAHGLAQIGRKFIILWFRDEVDLTPAMGLAMFGLYSRLFGAVAARLEDDAPREIVANFSDGCETEGEYRRLSFSCSRPDTILIPDYLFTNSNGYADLRRRIAAQASPWREREEVVFWRGAANGRPTAPPRPGPWSWHQRLHLCQWARESRHAARADIGIPDHDSVTVEAVKPAIEAAGFIRPSVPKETFLRYRYLVDVDGWSNAWGLIEKLLMGATVLKVGSAFGYRQWYYDRLEPWAHYVPVAADLSDFEAVLDRLFADPAEAERIAAQGRAFAETLDPAREMAEAEQRVSAAILRGR
jgi:hypothetical protein